MDNLKAPSLPSLLDSDRGSCDSLIDSSQFDIEELDDIEYSLPPVDSLPTLESVLSELHCEENDSVLDARGTPSTNSIDLQNYNQNECDNTNSHPQLGSVLRHVFLQGVSSQIQSASERINAGLASVIAVQDMIAVGTSHGHVLCFDAGQTLRWCCTDYLLHGAVSALAFNSDCTRLLVGYARGHMVMLNNSTGDTLRSVSECHTPNTAILSLRWLSTARALCLDSGGSVWSLTFTRRLGVRGCESRCLFSGARGEVCTLEPLLLDDDHPLKLYCVTAFATMSKIIIVTLKPRLRVVWTQPLVGSTQYLPLLAWQLVVIQSSDLSKNRDPVLAYARGTELYFNQIVITSGRIRCTMLCRVTLSCPLLALHWLGARSLGCMDSRETLRLMDVRSTSEQECIELGNIGMVYGSAYYKGLATGGNVSPALALAGTHACYNSMASKGSQLLILGHKGLHAVTVRSWSERLSHLTNTNRWSEAFNLIIEGYHAASERLRRQTMIKEKAVQLVHDYLSKTHRTPEIALEDVFKCCVELKEESCLWGELWDRLEDSPQTFIELLVPYILDGMVPYVAPYITQAMVEHYTKTDIKMLQNVILKLDVTCLDLHQVLSICRKCQLFSAFIYVTTRALGDYTLPITELIPILNNLREKCTHRQSSTETHNGHNENPNGELVNPDEVQNNKINGENILGSCNRDSLIDTCLNCGKIKELGDILLVYISGCLAGKMFPCGDLSSAEEHRVKNEVLGILIAMHSSAPLDGELSHPYLRSLLQYDTREALNIISLAFQEPYFNSDLGQAQRLRIINVLMDIIEPDKNCNEAAGCFLYFISQQICYKVIPSNKNLLQKVIDYVMMPLPDKMSLRQHSERQFIWQELRNSGNLSHIPIPKQIVFARRAHCYRVLEELLEINKDFEEIIMCYLSDIQRKNQVFHYIEKHAASPERAILKQIEDHIEQLLLLDSEKTAKAIAQFFPDSVDKLCSKLATKCTSVYLFLQALVKCNVKLSPNSSEMYLDLLCQIDKQFVTNYLKNCDTYRDDYAIDIMKKYNYDSGLVYLLEKRGDYISAFNILFKVFNKAIDNNENVEKLAHDVCNLCSRSSKNLSQSKRESLWFPFLELALSNKELKGIMRVLLHSASPHVRLPALVQLVVKSGAGGKFGDIKQVLAGMLVNSKYETVLLETTSCILNSDLHHILAKDLFKSHRALSVRLCICLFCNKNLSLEPPCLVYGCGHGFHMKCSHSQDQCPLCGFEAAFVTELNNYNYPKQEHSDEDIHLNLKATFRPDLDGMF